MTRHQRRKLARRKKDAKAALLLNRALNTLKVEKAKANLSSDRSLYRDPKTGKMVKQRRTPTGLVSSIYSGAANPMGFTRPLTWTKGEAK